MVPIGTKMIDTSLLSGDEVRWLDEYHRKVWDSVSPRLQPGDTLEWLRRGTRSLAEQQK